MQPLNFEPSTPVIFIDIDDVLCLNEPFGGVHVRNALLQPAHAPTDLWDRLFRGEAVQALNKILHSFNPQAVITSSWLSLLERSDFVRVFESTGLEQLVARLHQFWDAPADYGTSRLEAIDGWLNAHHARGPVLIIDDYKSGESLVDSFHHQAGRALLCELGRGFHSSMVEAASRALRRPYSAAEPWN